MEELSAQVNKLETTSASHTRQAAAVSAQVLDLAPLPTEIRSLTTKVDGLSQVTTDMITDLTAKIGALTAETQHLVTRVAVLEATHTDHTSEITQLTKANAELTAANAELASRVDSLERSTLADNLIIAAVPVLEGEDLKAIFLAIFTRLETDVSPADLLGIKRINSKKNSNKPRLILAKLKNVECRNGFLAAKRSHGSIYADELGSPQEQVHSPIFLNEHLPLAQTKFLGKVRAYARERGYRYVWFKNGSIIVKRDAVSEPITNKSQTDLHLLSAQT